MACKPKLGMKKVLAKDGYFIEGVSHKEAAKTLASRWGGSEWGWEEQVREAVHCKTLIAVKQEGKTGFRTLTHQERSTSVANSAPYSHQLVTAS